MNFVSGLRVIVYGMRSVWTWRCANVGHQH